MTGSLRVTVLLMAWLASDWCLVYGDGPSAPTFQQATAGYRYRFPIDHGSHPSYRTEWWYYTGHLQAKGGRPFGFELTFFRRAVPPEDVKTRPSRWSVDQLYLAHFAVTDIAGQRFHVSEKLSRAGVGKAGADVSQLRVWIDDWRAEASAEPSGSHTLLARDGPLALSLTLQPSKSMVIHGRDGISRKGAEAGQSSHYYSFTRLATTGSLSIDGERFDVTGSSWMDHEFGSADLDPKLAGWDWFGIQLENQTELMLYRLRRQDGTADPVSSGTFIDRDGRGHHVSIADLTLEPLSYWTSPTSQARYPQRWRLTVPSRQLSLELVPRMSGQELITKRSTQVTYWEGAVEATGTSEGQPVRGKGYMELTGYAERIPNKL